MNVDKNLDSVSDKKLVHRARERLLYCLDRRLHSEKELRDKLFGKYPPHIIDTAISEIADLGLVDDLKFARAFAEHRKNVQKKGPYKVRQELFAKGVCREFVDIAVEEVFSDEDDEVLSALLVAEKYRDCLGDIKGRQRCYNALIRKGFSFDVSKKAMQKLCDLLNEQDY